MYTWRISSSFQNSPNSLTLKKICPGKIEETKCTLSAAVGGPFVYVMKFVVLNKWVIDYKNKRFKSDFEF